MEEESRCHELMRKEIRKEHEATVSRLADVESEADAVVQSCTNSFKENARLNETIKSIDVRCAKVATIVSRAEAKSSSMNAALAKNANKAEIAASSCSHIVIANDAIDLVRSEMQRAICTLTQLTAAVPSKELIDDIRERAKRLEQREAALAARKVILREMGAGIDEKLSFIIKERESLGTLKETSASLSAQMASCVNEEHVESETIEVLEKRFAKINELKASLSKKKALDSEVALLEARLKERQEEAEHKQGELVRRLEAINLSRAKLQDAKENWIKFEGDTRRFV
ncbi:unnamed protein product [Toxocara canis]|uniref:Uncharacterized protein n=1 Tax=Toxocara canis TaxID=6265 RepID=A0A3P7IS93_TOXCA|nr:unnamed protein product [Toxocara canis]